MENKEMKSDIQTAVMHELENARGKFENMHSYHEGYAVVLEEFQELQQEVNAMDQMNKTLWFEIKSNIDGKDKKYILKKTITCMKDISENVTKEAIQLQAMMKRFEQDLLLNKEVAADGYKGTCGTDIQGPGKAEES